MLSFWEKQILTCNDFVIIGAGIMGCSVAFELRQKYPAAKILVIEHGLFPNGASTKNAGFACFGSPTEMLSDIKLLGKEKTYELIGQRFEGLGMLTERFGDEKLDRTTFGGYELIFKDKLTKNIIDELNEWLMPIFKTPVFSDVSNSIQQFGFSNTVQQMLFCNLESQIDSGKLMMNYWKLLQENNIQIISGANVQHIHENTVEIYNDTTDTFTIKGDKIIVTTNAFAKELLPDIPIKPGRGQVILTNVIEDLAFRGSYHFDEGYYYFRNVGKRVLFGGGRNIDFVAEETTAFEPNHTIIDDLKTKLREIILPDTSFEIEHMWQGIMGFSENKLPVIINISDHIRYIMSCNGMGIALSPFIAKIAVNDL